MSVSVPVGIDFGTGKTVLGVARNRGIDIVVNEVSNRSTPSLVGFGYKNRFLGESAKSQETSNIKNTVSSLKRLVGRSKDDPDMEEERQFNASQIVPVNDVAGVKVNYLGKPHEFTFTQLSAMFFNKLKQTLLADTHGNINDVVISVPPYFVDAQRRAVADAAVIAGLNPVRIINDVSAAAIGHGVFRTDLPEDSYKTIAVVDIGYSDYTVSIVSLKKGEGRVLATECSKDFGGRNIDLIIAKHFTELFKEKYKIDVTTNPKAWGRVLQQSEKLKKILSANSTGMFNVESLMNDIDVSASMKRSELEEYLQPVLEQLHIPIDNALAAAGIKAEDLDAVEVIGGSTRVPSVKEKIAEAFGKPLSFTMNQDEAIARGAAFVCAVHSPLVRVRPFKFEDYNNHSVTFSWEKSGDEDTDHLEVFPKGSPFPSTKVITLYRDQDFSLSADYTNPSELHAGINPHVGTWKIVGVKPTESGEPSVVKLKIRQDPSGLYLIESAYISEEAEVEETVPGAEGEEPKTQTVKKWVKKADLIVEHYAVQLSVGERDKLVELEAQMAAEDKLVEDTENKKNALEEYIYDIRDKLEGVLAEFVQGDEKERLTKLTDAAEEWLYGDGEDATKGLYVAKLEELTSIGNLIKGRHSSKLEADRQAKQAKLEAQQQQKMAEKLQADKAAREAKEKEDNEKSSEQDANMPDQE
ncbi:adenyl-nucleotide exchange factor [Starmerella bacillaris]|uniref:Adenyl-nucleotide exchange factor n=1 Tax=Starmerella bacillaris TaxID=1247836 RepID=A0AAV5RL53_STABA|nr:adenyl-nucleotide exchange factor [Starmerella bacillaris]